MPLKAEGWGWTTGVVATRGRAAEDGECTRSPDGLDGDVDSADVAADGRTRVGVVGVRGGPFAAGRLANAPVVAALFGGRLTGVLIGVFVGALAGAFEGDFAGVFGGILGAGLARLGVAARAADGSLRGGVWLIC